MPGGWHKVDKSSWRSKELPFHRLERWADILPKFDDGEVVSRDTKGGVASTTERRTWLKHCLTYVDETPGQQRATIILCRDLFRCLNSCCNMGIPDWARRHVLTVLWWPTHQSSTTLPALANLVHLVALQLPVHFDSATYAKTEDYDHRWADGTALHSNLLFY